ncbi:MAG: phage tail protein [Myxococcota bacterium]|jgi:phage tail-like protein|nr:phage tail protein [Myxococcota bacterium]
MSARRELDPVTNFSFEVDGITQGKFAGVDGLSYEIEMIEYRVSDEPMLPRFRPGLPKYGRITLKRGYVMNPEFNEWITQVQAGNYERKDGSIVLKDYYGEEVRRWNLYRCLPTKWNIGSLEGKGTEALYESLELVVEEIKQG